MSRPPPQKNVALARDGMCSKKTSSSALAVFHECDRRTDGRTETDRVASPACMRLGVNEDLVQKHQLHRRRQTDIH